MGGASSVAVRNVAIWKVAGGGRGGGTIGSTTCRSLANTGVSVNLSSFSAAVCFARCSSFSAFSARTSASSSRRRQAVSWTWVRKQRVTRVGRLSADCSIDEGVHMLDWGFVLLIVYLGTVLCSGWAKSYAINVQVLPRRTSAADVAAASSGDIALAIKSLDRSAVPPSTPRPPPPLRISAPPSCALLPLSGVAGVPCSR